MDRDDSRGRQPWSLRSRDTVEVGMNYESSAEDCKFDNRCKRQNRGPYLEDKCQEHNVIEKTIVDIWQYLGKSEKCHFCTIVSLFRIFCY